MATTRRKLTGNERPTKEQLKEIDIAKERGVSFDEDSPELTPSQLKKLAAIARQKRDNQRRQLISLRVSPETISIAKLTGKGYTGFLARLLDNAIKDAELVQKSL